MPSKLTTLAQQKTAAQLQTLTQDSIKWLLRKIADMKKTSNIASMMNREQFRKNDKFILGGLYYFYYDPKTKDDMPYYDRFPLVLIIDRYPDGFLGLNLHYLPLKYRVAFLDKLLDYAVYTPEDEIKRIRISYEILSMSRRMKEFNPCIKRYLNSQIQSKMLTVQPNEWDIAIFLPIQQFKKAKATKVWEDSVKQIRNS